MNSWQAQVQSTPQFTGSTLTVTVTYTAPDGSQTFGENIMISGTQQPGWLSAQIQNRINQLNDLWSYQSTIQNDPAFNNVLTCDMTSGILTAISANAVSSSPINPASPAQPDPATS